MRPLSAPPTLAPRTHPHSDYPISRSTRPIFQITMWNVASSKEEVDTKFSGDAVLGMATGANATRLAVGGKGPHAIVYELKLSSDADEDGPSLRELYRVKPTGTVLSLSLSADASVLVTGGESKLVELFDLAAKAAGGGDETIAGGVGGRSSSAESTSAIVATPSRKGSRIAQPPQGLLDSTRSSMSAISKSFSSLSAPSRKKSAQRRKGGGVTYSTMQAEAAVQELPCHAFKCSSVVHSVSLDASGKHLAIGCSETTDIYQVEYHNDDVGGAAQITCEPLMWLDCAAQQGGVSFSKSQGKLAIGGAQLVTVFDIVSGGTVANMPHDGRVRCVALSSNGAIVVIGGFDRKMTLHNIGAGAEVYDFECADDLIRTVHLSADSSRLAIGSDKQGKGWISLYDANDQVLLGEWEHPKPVWSVRLSPNGRLLAAAGYGFKMVLYDTATLQLLQEIKYTSKIGPAFIWSMAFSDDNRRLALGCWSGNTHIYEVSSLSDLAPADSTADASRPPHSEAEPAAAVDAAAGRSSEEVMREVAVIARGDRVYAVALDAEGAHLCIGGRDKKVALFELLGDAAKGSERHRLVWEVAADDFVYTAVVSTGLRYCAYGGTSRAVVVLDGRTGIEVHRIATLGTIWDVNLLGDTPILAMGGEVPTVTVYDVDAGCDLLRLPTDEVTYGVSLTKGAFGHAFSNLRAQAIRYSPPPALLPLDLTRTHACGVGRLTRLLGWQGCDDVRKGWRRVFMARSAIFPRRDLAHQRADVHRGAAAAHYEPRCLRSPCRGQLPPSPHWRVSPSARHSARELPPAH